MAKAIVEGISDGSSNRAILDHLERNARTPITTTLWARVTAVQNAASTSAVSQTHIQARHHVPAAIKAVSACAASKYRPLDGSINSTAAGFGALSKLVQKLSYVVERSISRSVRKATLEQTIEWPRRQFR